MVPVLDAPKQLRDAAQSFVPRVQKFIVALDQMLSACRGRIHRRGLRPSLNVSPDLCDHALEEERQFLERGKKQMQQFISRILGSCKASDQHRFSLELEAQDQIALKSIQVQCYRRLADGGASRRWTPSASDQRDEQGQLIGHAEGVHDPVCNVASRASRLQAEARLLVAEAQKAISDLQSQVLQAQASVEQALAHARTATESEVSCLTSSIHGAERQQAEIRAAMADTRNALNALHPPAVLMESMKGECEREGALAAAEAMDGLCQQYHQDQELLQRQRESLATSLSDVSALRTQMVARREVKCRHRDMDRSLEPFS